MNNCRVLLADDEAAILEGYKLLFDWEKYQCEIAGTAMDGQEAVEKARELKPDIVIKNKMLGQVFVMDTKWKVLSDAKANYGISQADMYQMYAYQKKYTSENVTLLYPLTEKVEQGKDIRFLSHDGTEIKIRFIDLFDLSNSLKAIVKEIMETE